MITTYTKLTWRNVKRRWFYSAIKILGLALGLACLLIIIAFARIELRFDAFFKDSEQIFRLLNYEKDTGNKYAGSASAIGAHLKQELPQIDEVVRVFMPYRIYSTSALVRHGENAFFEDNIMEADSAFFSVFDFNFLAGDARTALRHPSSVIISQRAATKYFSDNDPLNKTLIIDNVALHVTAVVEVPEHTHLSFDFLRPAHHNPSQLYVWEHTLAFTYFKLKHPDDRALVQRLVRETVIRNLTTAESSYLRNYESELQPLSDVHTTVLDWDIIIARPSSQIWAVVGIAIFILILSVINFINLATALSSERAKEVGINKILGASTPRLTSQFFLEFAFITGVAGLCAIVIAIPTMPVFNDIMGTSMSTDQLLDPFLLTIFFVTLAVTAALSGLYPAYVMASFVPTDVIQRTKPRSVARLREVLVVAQFCISIVLVSGTLIIREQIDFVINADLGVDHKNIYVLRLREATRDRFQQIANTLREHPNMIHVAGASSAFGGEYGSDTFHPDHMPDATTETFARNIAVDTNFFRVFGIELLAGQNFTNPSFQHRNAYVINETAVKQYRLTDPIGANFHRSGEQEGRVIGVIKDFSISKLTNVTQPLVLYADTIRASSYMFIKYADDPRKVVAQVNAVWNQFVPELPMEGFFQDEYFNALYKQEERTSKVATIFCAIALFLACLGLLGMASFLILKRTKEIGIRKVVGASVLDIWILLSSSFFKVITIAAVVSAPIVYYFANDWLSGFTVRIDVSPKHLVLATGLTLTLALLTISSQAIRAAKAKPVNALKQE